MRNLLRKFHIGGSGNTSEETDGAKTPLGRNAEGSGLSHRNRGSPSESPAGTGLSDQKPLSGFSNWINSVTRHTLSSGSHGSPSGSSGGSSVRDRLEGLGSTSATPSGSFELLQSESATASAKEAPVTSPLAEEEYQIQLAMELSAKEDPEVVQIEAMKQPSLDSSSCHSTTGEVIAYRYWNYNALDYDEKIVDGFYDWYGALCGSTSEKMPSLIDLKGSSATDEIRREVILVNKSVDLELPNLVKRALELITECKSG
eukprot:TRINITY_DN5089_c0_g2_i3.p2 TRINITY_DN5089_c0_g2~~TRINITY_DN5089_c0_g2_i3.p2  ORF type:complete len:258 (+),score=51.00 TRINITY_DN5089_c0_g2_i3:92-865(+)